MHRVGLKVWLVAALLAPAGLCAQQDEERIIFQRADVAKPPPTTSDADLDALQFSGVTSILGVRSFNFTDSRTRKSFWVPAGGTENNFSIDSYDPANEQVVVRRGARTRPISLRKAVLVATPTTPAARPNVPAAPPVPTAAGRPRAGVDEIKNPKTPEEIKQAEFEARMLVSDLLDISMKAREEQRKLKEAQARGQPTPAPAR